MNEDIILDLFRDAIFLILGVSAPMMITALVVGLVIAIFQATTQIQEQTLAFVPKLIAIFLVILVLGPWIIDQMVVYTQALFENLVMYIQ